MKKLIVLSISALLSAASFTGYANILGKDPVMTRTFPASSVKEVEAITSGGSLTLTGDAGSEAIVEVYASHSNCSDEKIKQILEESYIIDIKVESGKLYAAAKSKKRFSQGLSISFKITVPNRVTGNLQTSGGSIRIGNLTGAQNFKTSGGSLVVENLSGSIVGRTSGGSITITGSKDNINLATSGGSITAKDCSGKIELKTSGGSLHLTNLSGNIYATTSGGSVRANNIKGTLKTGTSGGSVSLSGISGNVEASTSGGSMDVKMKSVSDFVKLSNSGNLSLSLPAGKDYILNVKANKVESFGLKNFRGNIDSKYIEGATGSGGPEINVKSSQRVRLSFE